MNGSFFFAKVQVPCVTHIPGLWFNNEQKFQFLNMIKQQILFNDFTLPSSGSQHLLREKFWIFKILLIKYIDVCKMMEKFPLSGDQFQQKLNIQWEIENSGNWIARSWYSKQNCVTLLANVIILN